mmetsp:Transcript_3813/g.7218  ORF Transcript_3813/g.7218 Transcript_3813/m.7218 type:complete len:218 (+) Transcript_3813:71-724(+)
MFAWPPLLLPPLPRRKSAGQPPTMTILTRIPTTRYCAILPRRMINCSHWYSFTPVTAPRASVASTSTICPAPPTRSPPLSEKSKSAAAAHSPRRPPTLDPSESPYRNRPWSFAWAPIICGFWIRKAVGSCAKSKFPARRRRRSTKVIRRRLLLSRSPPTVGTLSRARPTIKSFYSPATKMTRKRTNESCGQWHSCRPTMTPPLLIWTWLNPLTITSN